jgi:hypothetical protein
VTHLPRYRAGIPSPPGTCRICGMHDPDGLTHWGGLRAHETCIEWLNDPSQTPLPCVDHSYGPWAPLPSDGRPKRRRHCTKCDGYQTAYTDKHPVSRAEGYGWTEETP